MHYTHWEVSCPLHVALQTQLFSSLKYPPVYKVQDLHVLICKMGQFVPNLDDLRKPSMTFHGREPVRVLRWAGQGADTCHLMCTPPTPVWIGHPFVRLLPSGGWCLWQGQQRVLTLEPDQCHGNASIHVGNHKFRITRTHLEKQPFVWKSLGLRVWRLSF
jgi:hypothetical protein